MRCALCIMMRISDAMMRLDTREGRISPSKGRIIKTTCASVMRCDALDWDGVVNDNGVRVKQWAAIINRRAS